MASFAASAVFVRKNGSFGDTGLPGLSFVSSASAAQSSRSLDGQGDAVLSSVGYYSGTGNRVLDEENIAFDDAQGIVKDPGGTFADSTSRSGIISYVVRKGDTLASIAQNFGITSDTIVNANSGIKSGTVKPGQTLKILPVSGVIYVSREGDSLASIASSFNVSEDEIIAVNPSANLASISDLAFLNPSTSLIIPN